MDTVFMRLGILLLLALVVTGVWRGLRWRGLRRVQQLSEEALPLPESIIAQLAGGSAAILAFSTKTCVECRTRQAPALNRLKAAISDLQVVALDPLEHPDLVAQLGILTVPTTVVLDSERHVRHLNLGYASDGQLREQLAGIV